MIKVDKMNRRIYIGEAIYPIRDIAPEGYERINVMNGVADGYEFYCNRETEHVIAVTVEGAEKNTSGLSPEIKTLADEFTERYRNFLTEQAEMRIDVKRIYRKFLEENGLDGEVETVSHTLGNKTLTGTLCPVDATSEGGFVTLYFVYGSIMFPQKIAVSKCDDLKEELRFVLQNFRKKGVE